jgi:hypothetical protein
MSIAYTYEITSVDTDARVMEVVYTSPGRQTMHIGARLPYVGESLEAVIQMYSPVAYWLSQEAEVITPNLIVGQITPPEPPPVTLESTKAAKLAELANWRYQREISGIMLGGARIKTDRESQATISGAYSSLKDGLITSVDWKADNGQWITIGLLEMTAIAQAVAVHVQQCFALEKGYVDQVTAATTIEEVQAVVPETVFQV